MGKGMNWQRIGQTNAIRRYGSESVCGGRGSAKAAAKEALAQRQPKKGYEGRAERDARRACELDPNW